MASTHQHISPTLTFTFFIACSFSASIAISQPFHVPPLDSLRQAVSRYYVDATEAQLLELKQSNRYRWVNYLPNPGFNPFTGGFNIQFNLAAPFAEFKSNHAAKQKAAAIKKLNEIEAAKTKNAVEAAYESIQFSIQQYNAQDSLVYFKDIAFDLYSKQYERNEMLPSEYLAKQQERQQFKLSRLQQANAIKESIRQLLLTAFYPISTHY